MKTLSRKAPTFYLAKEPGVGVRSDLFKLSGEIVIVACNGYGDWYRKKGYNVINAEQYFENTMHFTQTIGNPPYSDRSKMSDPNGGGNGGNLDAKFFLKSMEVSHVVSLIIRAETL